MKLREKLAFWYYHYLLRQKYTLACDFGYGDESVVVIRRIDKKGIIHIVKIQNL